jgi:hypothetical protein
VLPAWLVHHMKEFQTGVLHVAFVEALVQVVVVDRVREFEPPIMFPRWVRLTALYENAVVGQRARDESFLADIANRLATEDRTFIKFRDAYQALAESKEKAGTREGFKNEAD